MPRKIYEKAIYSRESQMTRKVYERANNVLPVYEPSTYKIKTVTVKTAGTGYDDSFTMTFEGDTDAVVTLTATDGAITAATITTAGVLASDISGDIEVTSGNGSDGVITIACEEISE